MSIVPFSYNTSPTLSANKRRSDTKMKFVDVELKEIATKGSSMLESEEGEGEEEPQGSSMNRTKWLACVALALSYSTAIQQHACTATIVKHIDARLGAYKHFYTQIQATNDG